MSPMSQTIVAILVGLLAAAGAVLMMDTLREDTRPQAAAPMDLGAIEARLREIERRLPAEGGGAQLSTSGVHPAVLERLERIEAALEAGGGALGADGAAGGGPLARIEQRLGSIEEKLEAGEPRRDGRRGPRKKRVSLAEAAAELELSAAQEDELRRIYERFHDKMYRLAAGPDGNPDDVKRDVAEAAKDPAKRMTLVGKYMPNVLNNIGGMMEAQAERQSAIQEALGPEKAARLGREFDVREDNVLGLGGSMRTEVSVDDRR